MINDYLGNMQNALFELKINLTKWLEEKLSHIDEHYWDNLVVPKLSYSQTLNIEHYNIKCMENLDLSCILRIFDKNWYELTFRYNIKSETRIYLKRLQSIRNKYAHISSQLSISEVQNDFDTLKKFLICLKIGENLLEDIDKYNKEYIPIIEQNPIEIVKKEENTPIENEIIKIQDIVEINAIQGKNGVVLGISNDEYSVFVDNEIKTFYKGQISKAQKKENPFIKLSLVRNYLSSYIIRHPTTSSLYSLNAARINLIPYQFKPVMKIIKSDQPRLLIADSVGIGKTIEAGLILRELQVRNNTKSVLIICPKPLVSEKKWEQEMKRFDENFEALDSRSLKYCIEETDLEGEWPEKYQKVILPYSVCDNEMLKNLEKLKPFPKFDLIIVDEAHHIRNQQSIRHQIVQKFTESAEAVVFLTATPIQLGNNDLYALLHLLRPDLIVDEDTFNIIHTPNKYITQAVQEVRNKNFKEALDTLYGAARTAGGKFIYERPEYKEITDRLKNQKPTKENIVELSDSISKLHTFNGLINRTLRKEISSDFCIRKPETVRTKLTKDEKYVFDNLRKLKAEMLSNINGIKNVNFVMTTLERQAASCIHGLVPLINDILNKTLIIESMENYNDEDDNISEIDDEILNEYRNKIKIFVEEANKLSPIDPKFENFYTIIKEKQSLENKKVIVFSTFRHTLKYLYNKLDEKNIRVGIIHGGINDDERLKIREKFEKNSDDKEALDVLLFSEVGCEGLDYQFCDTMINYDLPWNPMKIEQRIGRIDRFGQKSEAVAIYNMIVEDTIDAHIYDRCLNRIKIFEQSIGDCDEILGDIHNAICKVCLSTTLSDEQKKQKLEKIGENEYLNIIQQRELEKQQSALFTIPSKISSMAEFESFENYWTSPIALEYLVSSYLKEKVSTSFTGLDTKRTLRLSKDDRNKLFEEYLKLETRKGKIYKDWEKYLKGDEQYCSFTFDIEEASKNRDIQFIMPLHPLVLMAAKYFRAEMPITTALQIVDTSIPEGIYPFLIYSWEYIGKNPNVKLKTVCTNDIVAHNILNFIEIGAEININKEENKDIEFLRDLMHKQWEDEIKEYKLKVQQQINYQINSLKVSSEARKNVASRNNLVNIREKMIINIERDTNEKILKLEEQAKNADILSKQILSGMIKIVH